MATIIKTEDLLAGEVKPKSIRVRRTDGALLFIDSATYQVFDASGTALGSATPAVVDTDTVTATVSAAAKGAQYVELTYNVGSYVGKARLTYNVL